MQERQILHKTVLKASPRNFNRSSQASIINIQFSKAANQTRYNKTRTAYKTFNEAPWHAKSNQSNSITSVGQKKEKQTVKIKKKNQIGSFVNTRELLIIIGACERQSKHNKRCRQMAVVCFSQLLLI